MKKILAFSLIPALFGFFLPNTWWLLKLILFGIAILCTAVVYLDIREYLPTTTPHLLLLALATIGIGFLSKVFWEFNYINIFYACYIVMLVGSWFLLVTEDA